MGCRSDAVIVSAAEHVTGRRHSCPLLQPSCGVVAAPQHPTTHLRRSETEYQLCCSRHHSSQWHRFRPKRHSPTGPAIDPTQQRPGPQKARSALLRLSDGSDDEAAGPETRPNMTTKRRRRSRGTEPPRFGSPAIRLGEGTRAGREG